MSTNTSQLAAYIWSLADLLRGDFKQSQYGRVILPFTILRRLECVLEETKAKVLKEGEKQAGKPEEAREKFPLKAAGHSIYNTSAMDPSKLRSTDIGSNLQKYVQSFSRDAREIARITKTFGDFEAVETYELDKEPDAKGTRGRVSTKKAEPKTLSSKIFRSHEFGYRRITIERPHLNSHLGRKYFDLLGWGSAQKNISVPILQNTSIVWPSRREQKEIVLRIREQRRKFSSLVTGKIDVRNWKPPEPNVEQDVA